MHLHLLLLLLPLASSCPGDAWVAAGSSCYLSSSASMSWWAALEFCELEGGYMVEVVYYHHHHNISIFIYQLSSGTEIVGEITLG